MAKFNYKFESVKQVKIALEKKVQKELTVVEMQIKKKLEEIEELLNEKGNYKAKTMSKKSLKVAELKFLSDFEKLVDGKVEIVKDEIQKLESERVIKRQELSQKSKETKMFEKLEEKHKIEHIKVQSKLEQIEIDDIATKKFIRGN